MSRHRAGTGELLHKEFGRRGLYHGQIHTPEAVCYFLTPKGSNEKTRLTSDLLQDYTKDMGRIKKDEIFSELLKNGVESNMIKAVFPL